MSVYDDARKKGLSQGLALRCRRPIFLTVRFGWNPPLNYNPARFHLDSDGEMDGLFLPLFPHEVNHLLP
jgi:hypothetical protein